MLFLGLECGYSTTSESRTLTSFAKIISLKYVFPKQSFYKMSKLSLEHSTEGLISHYVVFFGYLCHACLLSWFEVQGDASLASALRASIASNHPSPPPETRSSECYSLERLTMSNRTNLAETLDQI